MNWEKIQSRLSVPGLALVLLGVATVTQAPALLKLALKDKAERWIMPFKAFGLALTILGAVILLDLIPGL